MTQVAEGIQWIMTILNTVHSIVDTAGKVNEKIPEEWKQRLPGFLGLSLADEQIFNSVLGQLTPEEQVVIMAFLAKCKDYERNRFINVVAGMEVIEQGKTEEKKESFDNDGKKVVETKTGSKGKKDTRKDFLEKFAKVITDQFQNDFDKAYQFCVAGRMIIPDPVHQKMLRKFSDSTAVFKKFILDPFKALTVNDLKNNILTRSVKTSATKIADAEKRNFQNLGSSMSKFRTWSENFKNLK